MYTEIVGKTKEGSMDFKRARSKEQFEQREMEIMNAAMQIYDEHGFEEITFGHISEKTHITRPAIYQYFSTKEEILLKLTAIYLEKFTQYLESELGKTKKSNENIATALTNAFIEVPQFIKLYSVLYAIIEKNVSLEALTQFKIDVVPIQYRFLALLKKQYPHAEDETIYNFMLFYLSFAGGLYPMTKETNLQKEAAELSNTGYKSPVFENVFKSTLLIHLESISKNLS